MFFCCFVLFLTQWKTQLSEVRSEAWVEKIKSHSVRLNFPKGSNCSVFSNVIPLFTRFLFPLGARTFSVPIGHLFSIFGAELKRYLSRYLSRTYTEVHLSYAVWVWPKSNKVLRRCHSRTPLVQLKKKEYLVLSGCTQQENTGRGMCFVLYASFFCINR